MTTALTTIKDDREPVLMPEEDKNLLKDLYLLRSYSGFEDPIRLYIARFLTELGIPFINYNGNILGFNYPGAPLFSAHLDMVNTEGYKLTGNEYALDKEHVFTLDSKACIRLYRDKEKKHQTSLGADDKNGIWAILTMLKNGKEINFAFCHSEEIGGTGSEQVVSDKELAEFIEGCKFCIVIDRRNSSDIIGYSNKYCLVLDDKLEKFAKENGYAFTCTTGSVSDADRFSKHIECVNLSCGYYNPHSSTEYTNLNELYKTYLFCLDIIDNFQYESASISRVKAFKGISSFSSNTTYGRTYSGSTTYTGSTYYGRNTWSKETDKASDTDVKGSAVVTSQKKTSKEEKTTLTKNTQTTGTDIGIDYKELAEILVEAREAGLCYNFDLDAYVIPLYSLSELTESKLDKDILQEVKCTECEDSMYIIQGSVDELVDQYYYSASKWEPDKIYGICSECMNIYDVTDLFKFLL